MQSTTKNYSVYNEYVSWQIFEKYVRTENFILEYKPAVNVFHSKDWNPVSYVVCQHLESQGMTYSYFEISLKQAVVGCLTNTIAPQSIH